MAKLYYITDAKKNRRKKKWLPKTILFRNLFFSALGVNLILLTILLLLALGGTRG